MTPQRTWDLPKTLAKIDRCSPQIKIPTPGVQIEASRPCGRVRIQESGGGPKILQQEQDGSPKTLLQQEQDGQTTPKRSGTPKNLSPDWPLVLTLWSTRPGRSLLDKSKGPKVEIAPGPSGLMHFRTSCQLPLWQNVPVCANSGHSRGSDSSKDVGGGSMPFRGRDEDRWPQA